MPTSRKGFRPYRLHFVRGTLANNSTLDTIPHPIPKLTPQNIMETVQFPMFTSTAKIKLSTQGWVGGFGKEFLNELDTQVNSDPVLFTTVLEKLGITYLDCCRVAKPEYDYYFLKFSKWCLHSVLPFVGEGKFSQKVSDYDLLLQKVLARLLLSDTESERELVNSVIKFMYKESLTKSLDSCPWVEPKEAARVEFLKAALYLVGPNERDRYHLGFKEIEEVMEAGSKGIALVLADCSETGGNLTEPPEKWKTSFEYFQGKIYDYYLEALREVMTHGTLPIELHPVELKSYVKIS